MRVRLLTSPFHIDTEILAKYVKKMCDDAGYPMNVACKDSRFPETLSQCPRRHRSGKALYYANESRG